MKSEWKRVQLDSIVKFLNSKRVPISAMEREKIKGKYPYYGASGIVDYIDEYIFNGRYLLISEDGENLNTRKTPIAFIAKGKYWVNNHAHILDENEAGILDYLKYYFSILDIRPYITGAVQPKLNMGNLKRIPINLPPSNIRLNINQILLDLDDKIELNHKMNQTLEEMAQTLFKSWFVVFDPVHAKTNTTSNTDFDRIAKELGINRVILDLFPDGFEESELGMIPIGWKVKELGDFFPVVTGKKNANVATDDGKYIFFTCSQSTSKTDVYSFDAAAILLAGNCDFNVKWYRGKFEAYQRTYVLIPRNTEFLSFLYFLISYKLSDITQSSQGSVIKFITKGMIENYKIALPNEIVLKDLVGIFSNINFKIEGNLEQIKTLQKTRDTLLPKLLSGELDVSELELDNVTH